jgi:multidrug transporter EmrE-like cation transporter
MDEKLTSHTNSNAAPPEKSTIVGTIVFVGSLRILEGLGLSLPIALFFSGVLDLFVVYWIPPRPRAPFPKYALTIVLTWLGIVVSFWSIPDMLRKLLPVGLAYALPAFFFTVSLYGMPILLYGKRWHYRKTEQEIGFVRWIIGCAVFSLVVGGGVMIFNVVRHHN